MIKMAFLFPGQGSQYVGMGKDLYDNFKDARNTFEEANDILGFDVMKLCFEGDINKLTKTSNAQPAILAMSVAAYRTFISNLDLKPIIGAGHSLGEYSALTCNGTLSFEDALLLVKARGELMEEASACSKNAKMLAVRNIDTIALQKICKEYTDLGNQISIACYNSSKQNVVVGDHIATTNLANQLNESGSFAKILNVGGPFHSYFMQAAAEKFSQIIKKTKFNTGNWPVISNVTAKPYTSSQDIVNNLYLQMSHPVLWKDTMDYIIEKNPDMAVEMGPKNILSNLLKQESNTIRTICFEGKAAVSNFKEIQAEIITNKRKEKVRKCIMEATCIRNNSMNEYSRNDMQAYYETKYIYEDILENRIDITENHVISAINMLKLVMKIKNVSNGIYLEEIMND